MFTMKHDSAKKPKKSAISDAVGLLGGYEATSRALKNLGVEITGKAISKWVRAGRLPRTEATGESNYAGLLAKADPRIDRQALLNTVFRKAA